jgi:hypothetical protein
MMRCVMRSVGRAVLILQVVLPALAIAAEQQPISVELNGAEMAESRCRLTFVVENKNTTAVDSLKLDMFVFNQENRVYRRLLAEMGPLPREKTVVKFYGVDGPCGDIRSILVNEVTACPPAKPDSCLEGLALSSRVASVRFFK